MSPVARLIVRRWLAVFGLLVFWFSPASAQSERGSIGGTVVDQLRAGLQATVTLFRDGERVEDTRSDAQGAFRFVAIQTGLYRIEADASGFSTGRSAPVVVGASADIRVTLVLQIGPLAQHVVVTASATEVPLSQVGSPVTVIDAARLQDLAKSDVLESLKTVPGTFVLQTGQRGGQTDIFVRGGAPDFNKVLIDGVPANDIGGAFDFGILSAAGIDRVEVLRTANSVLYGADALSGVISLVTPRGRSSRPEFTYAVDGGTLGTLRQDVSLGGVVGRVDYYADASRFETDNDLPNNAFRSNTFAGRVGVSIGRSTDLGFTVRHVDAVVGLPGPVRFTGVADDSRQDQRLTVFGVTAKSQLTDRLRTAVRLTLYDRRSEYVNASPSGEPFDLFGFGVNYLGAPVTIVGGNGLTVSGQPILDFGGVYPSLFDSSTFRQSAWGQADYRLFDVFELSGGVRVEHEEGSQAGTFDRSATTRTNGGAFVEVRARMGERVFLTSGVGFENNAIFGFETIPRLSAVVYLRAPVVSQALLGDTKVVLNVGKGIKGPTVFDELNSAHAVLAALPGGDALIRTGGVEPIGAERSRSVDLGVEQGFWGSQLRARVAFFHNTFSDLVEFVPNAALPGLGVPRSLAFSLPFGATVNAASYRARGVETSADVAIAGTIQLAGSYTYLDATVTDSFSGSALAPTVNPAFPGVEIGAFSPLVGARPFRRPTHSGSLLATVTAGRVQATLVASFVGASDDSTFLFDRFFGNSLLLPNRDLTDGYRKVDVSGAYQAHPRVRWYVSLENVLDADYDGAAGFPALPRTIRTGVAFTLGGDVVR